MDEGLSKGVSVANPAVREAVQSFSGHVAHDLSNILTPLLAYPEMVAVELPEHSKAHGILDAMGKSAESAVALAGRLALLSGVMWHSRRKFDIAEILNSLVDDVSRRQPSGGEIHIHKMLASDIAVNMNQDALTQAFEEVLGNAMNAVDAKGTVSVSVEKRVVEDAFCATGDVVPPGTYACVEIEDDGAGMSAHTLQHAVDPFYELSGAGKKRGTGLGLSVAYSALRSNHGFLMFESEEGHGTLVTMLIPLEGEERPDVDRVNQAASMVSEEAMAAAGDGIPRVLVVDDEPSIVNLFKLILENYISGVTVDKAMNGEEALKLFREKRYDVVVLDLHMPVMDGQTAFVEFEETCKLKGWKMPSIVFCTGYAPLDIVKRAVTEDGPHTLLNKPVRSEVLVKAVRSRLGAAPE